MSHDKVWPEYPSEIYVDALEGELDAELNRDLASWLKSSDESRAKLEKLSRLRQNLKDSDDVVLPESGVYFDALEMRIMGALDAAIEAGDIASREVSEREAMSAPMPMSAAVPVYLAKVRRRARASETRSEEKSR